MEMAQPITMHCIIGVCWPTSRTCVGTFSRFGLYRERSLRVISIYPDIADVPRMSLLIADAMRSLTIDLW